MQRGYFLQPLSVILRHHTPVNITLLPRKISPHYL
nr:MAG TPA: hypothetical protein [Caudoviricetes sp.]